MLDSLGAFEDMPDWEELADLLFNAGQTVNPSEIHGVMVGLLASGFDPADDNHLAQTVAATERALGMDVAGELAETMGRLSLATLSAIVDSDYAFQPVLPSDDDAIETRLRSLSGWVTGFLSGFTEGVSSRNASSDAVDTSTADILRDFAMLAQVDTDEADSDDAERNLEELIEYVRLAAVSIVQDVVNNREF